MNRRSFLRFLGLAPVAAPIAAAWPLATIGCAPVAAAVHEGKRGKEESTHWFAWQRSLHGGGGQDWKLQQFLVTSTPTTQFLIKLAAT